MSSFERLLTRVIRQPAAATTPCPTAEMLAAYFDGALAGSEHAAVERHASTCARCSAHLAALVQLADRLDGPTAFARPWWRRHPWLVPAAALGRAKDLSGARVYATTWDYDGGWRTLAPDAGPHAFGGGDPARDARVLDAVGPLRIP